MAEFVEIMNIKRRMDNYYKDCADGCPLSLTNFCSLSENALTTEDLKEAEKIMLEWAEEHPIVYPTWVEWLSKQGLVELKTGQFARQAANEYLYEIKTVATLNGNASKQIPEDIAQKLGIEPKER